MLSLYMFVWVYEFRFYSNLDTRLIVTNYNTFLYVTNLLHLVLLRYF